MARKMSMRRMIDWLAMRKLLDTDWAAVDTNSLLAVSCVVPLPNGCQGSWNDMTSSPLKKVDTSGLLLDAVPWKNINCRN